jgi:DNA-binding LacI/PurR family transcriptional regulator
VRVRIAELGELALERLLRSINATGAQAIAGQTLGTQVIVRDSCRARAPRPHAADAGRGTPAVA